MDELELCPFCNGEAIIELVEVDEPFTFTDLYYRIRCKGCCLIIGHESIPRLPQFCPDKVKVAKQKLAEFWNRRG